MLISANTLLAPGDGDVGWSDSPSFDIFSSKHLSKGKQRNRVIIKFLSVQQLINVYVLSGVIQSR
ncbi:Alkaline phosphatase-like alpha/beta/alpha [Penicillium chrysogenum]|uniref:Alkaline phosphatase-like alpha/beta/alpha n=1 Tax=Penicillium chrysogenum TaxID=5076 RepID=A0ABQ8W4Z0_PENCH|nr:Alkaline phosphatase-like alpha/beta/alpha [Penicillium chrysogenum]XP_061070955.1 Alkaline phosphatase-like alpha/beta/alpha [Penicillium rubens]KAJ5236804.1 Alkaline phosphatase-like alpha/beta/alpha [Penicillium chrysogenum]KAJ5255704.1 Alkaline phosphatase-like alpha/beta/alpha [Penicillium chrysogenum]KAJ5276769.1 Alkaline phosphatase-like alpha/beta/alpha [Penicillium chrysogenum]KAJ5843271.1 Alkaline phosphatase-like alpha/beta/alpha [Penicillium rubens]KAJ5846146.1 Alkaline phospha